MRKLMFFFSSVNIIKPHVTYFSASLETRHWLLTSYTPLPAVFLFPPSFHASPSPITLSRCQCASRSLEALTHISAVYLSLCFHSACIPCSLIRSGYKEKGRAQRAREDGGKRLNNRNKKTNFPTIGFGLCVSASMHLFVTTQWRTEGQRHGDNPGLYIDISPKVGKHFDVEQSKHCSIMIYACVSALQSLF